MAGFQGVWGELGRIGSEQGCSDESGSVCHCSQGVARGPEWGKAGGLVVIDGHDDDDVTVMLGEMGVRGTGWGERRGLGGGTHCHW